MQAVPGQNVPPVHAAPAPADLVQLAVTLGLLVLVIFVGLLLIAMARRWLLGGGEKRGNAQDIAELLREYRRLREEGVITEEEYGRIRAAMLARGGAGRAQVEPLLPRRARERMEAAGPERGEDNQVVD